MRHLLSAMWLVVSCLLGSPALVEAQGSPVAVVIGIEGRVMIGESDQNGQAFDWVPVDSRIATGPRSHVVLAFANGARYEVESRTRAHVQGNTVQNVTGVVTEMLSTPAFPVRATVSGRTPAEPTDAERTALKTFAEAIGNARDPELLLLAAVVHLHWGLSKDADGYLQRAIASKAPPKLVAALQRQIPH